jgi:hypothetical protein
MFGVISCVRLMALKFDRKAFILQVLVSSFLAIFILIISFSIYHIIEVIAIVFGLPSWLIFVYYRRAKLQLQYEKEHPYPRYPELYNTRDIKLADAEVLDILFSKEEVYEERKIPRQSILKRDRFTCQSCGEPKTPENLGVMTNQGEV